MARIPNFPHTFVDGPGNVASGEQVMDNLALLRDAYNDDSSVAGSLPSSPVDGQEAYLLAQDGVVWKFRYRATSSLAYKWEFTGGGSLIGYEAGQQLAGDWGPILAIPRPGLYSVEYGHQTWHSTDGHYYTQLGLRNAGGSLADPGIYMENTRSGADEKYTLSRVSQVEVPIGYVAVTLTSNDSQGRTFNRFMRVTPICVS